MCRSAVKVIIVSAGVAGALYCWWSTSRQVGARLPELNAERERLERQRLENETSLVKGPTGEGRKPCEGSKN